ncbi:DNA-directed RNA polymerase III subunit RPC37-like protein [Guillardia theta CCMP2712]|uniref:DNA-directed RNA polymerase III subunit RPC37-like protein n=1 Tax=Guillardia theta (strain CCMP2712) TaxID=905079 RepID=L1ILE5_GUITC|nr:DNA-directed RNA polymerase III subunit RPC37-like protein [Guillardia theta CCMP2712]EKX36620.1 DNA-directed RNA polymerase III subunit RPC37-like protein [Guillardia theta CCMP2712]|eukprot:XP_005823600.1 DNA-directed RNA polymerase III subunit RPC37-like protein [Guillardia theta CCMP2712]
MMDDGSGSDNEPMQQVVQVRVSKRETERAREIRKSSYGYMREQQEKESWRLVNFYSPTTDQVNKEDYLNSLNAISKTRDDGVPAQITDLSREQLLRMSLPQQVQALMSAAHGCWVVRSELLYRDDPKQQEHVEKLRRCRYHILSRFRQSARVHASDFRRDFTREVSSAQLESMMFQIAVRREGCWEFRLQPDREFPRRFPDIHKMQEEKWDEMESHLAALTHPHKAAVARSSSRKSSSSQPHHEPQHKPAGEGEAAKSKPADKADEAARPPPSAAGMTPQEARQIRSAIAQTLKSAGVLSRDDLRAKLADHPSTAVSQVAASADSSYFDEIIAEQTEIVQGLHVLKNSDDVARNAVLQLFRQNAVQDKSVLVETVKNALGSEPGAGVINKLIRELATLSGTACMFKGCKPP